MEAHFGVVGINPKLNIIGNGVVYDNQRIPDYFSQVSGIVALAGTKYGQLHDGVNDAPKKLLEAALSSYPEMIIVDAATDTKNSDVVDETILTGKNNTAIYNAEWVAQFCFGLHNKLYESTLRYLQLNKMLPPRILVLGGDHSLAMGSISAVSDFCLAAMKLPNIKLPFIQPDLVIVWVDAHADINTPKSTVSGKLHGCPVSLLMGMNEEGWNDLTHFEWALEKMRLRDDAWVRPNRLVYIGLRDVDEAEKELLDKYHILQYDMEKVRKYERDMGRIVREAIKKVDPSGIFPIHLSFDIDGIDPIYTPSTGTPVPDGLLPEEGIEIIKLLKETGRLVSMDLVEVNLALGNKEDVIKTLHHSKTLIDVYLSEN